MNLRRPEIEGEPFRGHLGSYKAGQEMLQSFNAANDIDDRLIAAQELLVVLLEDFGLEPR